MDNSINLQNHQTININLENSDIDKLTISCFGTKKPTKSPSNNPTQPTNLPTTLIPTISTNQPSNNPTNIPTLNTQNPIKNPTKLTLIPTYLPTNSPNFVIIGNKNYLLGVNITFLMIVIGSCIGFVLIVCVLNKLCKLKYGWKENRGMMVNNTGDVSDVESEVDESLGVVSGGGGKDEIVEDTRGVGKKGNGMKSGHTKLEMDESENSSESDGLIVDDESDWEVEKM